MSIQNCADRWLKVVKSWPRRKQMILIISSAVLIVWVMPSLFSARKPQHEQVAGSGGKIVRYWTCAMHPQIQLPKPGQCPICAMDLIPVYENEHGDGDGSAVSLSLDATARRLAELQTEQVQYQAVFNEVRLVGKVDYDESRLSHISAWVPGRIERLFVDFTGTQVRKGDHLIQLYSPDLMAAQEEYIQAIKNWSDSKDSALSVMRDTSASTLKSAREKLRLWGISADQIKDIEERQIAQEHLTIHSPVSGTVIQKNGFEGQYVQTGDRIYTIADLSQVWLYLKAFESDIQWLHYGQRAQVEAEAYPGEIFSGKIAFIDPFVDEKTRTINLRVNVHNDRNRLKPGMFVRTRIKAELGEGGRIYEENLAGKWICPMHPEIIKEQEGVCDICAMKLIPTKEFGFAEQPLKSSAVLVIPSSAPLITGKRAVVYVEKMDEQGRPLYEGREVALGPRAGDQYVVFAGLKEGERVVTKGNFKIDSALQIQAQPSMMNPSGYYSEKDDIVSRGSAAPSMDAGVLAAAMPAYLEAVKALARDDPHKAAQSLEEFRMKLNGILPQTQGRDTAAGLTDDIKGMLQKMESIPHETEPLRTMLSGVSRTLKNILETYEYEETLTLYLIFCPMALDGTGAYWLQDTGTIANPYFGTKMPDCGSVQQAFGRVAQKTGLKGITGHRHGQ